MANSFLTILYFQPDDLILSVVLTHVSVTFTVVIPTPRVAI